MHANEDDQISQSTLLKLVSESVKADESLRVKFEIGDKFRFVRERLKELLAYVEEESAQLATRVVKKDITMELQENEVLVYVHLFNAKGMILRNWVNMINNKVFYEYSVNRPIYANQHVMDTLLRTKANKQQHAFLAIAIQKSDILQSADASDTPQLKVREGSLKLNRLLSFYHNENEYTWSSEGGFVKK